MNNNPEKKNSMTCNGICICHKTQKPYQVVDILTVTNDGRHSRYLARDIWPDDQVGVSIL